MSNKHHAGLRFTAEGPRTPNHPNAELVLAKLQRRRRCCNAFALAMHAGCGHHGFKQLPSRRRRWVLRVADRATPMPALPPHTRAAPTARSTQHAARSTQHAARSTQHAARSTRSRTYALQRRLMSTLILHNPTYHAQTSHDDTDSLNTVTTHTSTTKTKTTLEGATLLFYYTIATTTTYRRAAICSLALAFAGCCVLRAARAACACCACCAFAPLRRVVCYIHILAPDA
jgi:hypothetical protein